MGGAAHLTSERIMTDKEQIESLEATFDLRWKADIRAIKMWREANPGNDLVMPDHADLVCWLLDELSKLREKLRVANIMLDDM